MMRERINIEIIEGQLFEIKVVEPDGSKQASFTHYLNNYKNGVYTSEWNKEAQKTYQIKLVV